MVRLMSNGDTICNSGFVFHRWLKEFKYVGPRGSINYEEENMSKNNQSIQFPAFDANGFEIKKQIYGNTGGHCMVGTVAFYLPDVDRTVWVNCDEESVGIYSADTIWNEDGSDSWEHTEDYLLYYTSFDSSIPNNALPWLSMIKEALAYTIAQAIAHYHGNYTFSLPVVWLPDSIRERLGSGHLD